MENLRHIPSEGLDLGQLKRKMVRKEKLNLQPSHDECAALPIRAISANNDQLIFR